MKKINGGVYYIGTNEQYGFLEDKEGPQTRITINDFWIDATTVTNKEFQQFVQESGYVTEAERFGWSFVFHYFLNDHIKKQAPIVDGLSWWHAVNGADWRHPEGPQSTIEYRMDHPVTHVSRNDAVSYCKWAGKRLPTEAEWEIAAKGNTTNELYPWGNELLKNGYYHCNIWQGDFPMLNTLEDGYAGTAPVQTYDPNDHGLYQMIGNVWEWCVNPRRVSLTEFQSISGKEYWSKFQQINDEQYAVKGGSFLCHQSYCKRYRISARNGNTGMSSSNNTGFRCVKDNE